MRYVSIRAKQKREEETYRVYLTDALYASVNGGQTLTKRFIELLHPAHETQQTQEPEQSPQEIKDKIVGGLRRLHK